MLQSKITPIQCRDTALAFAFLSLLIWLFVGENYLIYTCMGIVLFAMIWPSGMIWPARLWFGFSHILGTVMSKVLLSIIYGLIVMPVAMVRRMLGKDSMQRKAYKASQDTAFVVREHTYTKDDLEHPY